MARPQCTATSKSTGQRCKLPAVPGKKVCKYHGGLSSGPPKGSKNALKTGERETITRASMSDEEKEYVDALDINPIELMKEQIRILKIKELRISSRMKSVLEDELFAGKVGPDGQKKSSTVPLTLNVVRTKDGDGKDGVTTATSSSETHALFYLRLEEAHNRILAQIRNATALLSKLQTEAGEGDEPLPLYTLPPQDVEAESRKKRAASSKKRNRKKSKKDG